jgi:hypothetical protein
MGKEGYPQLEVMSETGSVPEFRPARVFGVTGVSDQRPTG